MRRLTVIITGLLLIGCSRARPVSFGISTPNPTGDAYSCSLREINELGYTVKNASREAGFITAEKITSTGFSRVLSGNQWHSVLTVSIFEEPDSNSRRIRVTAAQLKEHTTLFTTARSSEEPSQQGISDAKALLSSCGVGEITRQALSKDSSAAQG